MSREACSAFIVLGLTVDIHHLSHADLWLPGLVFGVGSAFAIRPILIGLCLIPARLRRNERGFVLFAGPKGAVLILLGATSAYSLGSYLIAAPNPDSKRLYGIIMSLSSSPVSPRAARCRRWPEYCT